MEYTTGKLKVSRRGYGQFAVSSSHDHENWERDYFNVSGYFGSYGPDLIAAAPDLYEALDKAVSRIEDGDTAKLALAALAKARGETQ